MNCSATRLVYAPFNLHFSHGYVAVFQLSYRYNEIPLLLHVEHYIILVQERDGCPGGEVVPSRKVTVLSGRRGRPFE